MKVQLNSPKTLFWICFTAGLFLRLYALFSKTFWFDESITYFFAKLPIESLLLAVASDNNPPVYYLLVHFVQKFSQSEYILRLPSLIASIATIFATIKLSKNLGLKNPYFAASLLSLSPLAIYLSWEARMHSIASMFAVLLTISYFNLQKNFAPKNFLIFLGLATISFYTQYYLVFLLVPFTFIAFTNYKNHFGNLLKVAAASILLLVPWALYLQKFAHNACWCPNTIISLPATFVAPIVSGVGQITQRTYTNLPLPILAIFVVSCLLFGYFFLKGLTKDFKVSALYLISLATIAVPGLFLNVFSPKGFSIFAPLFFLIVAQSAPKTMQKILLLGLLFTISAIQFLHPHFQEYNLKALYQNLSAYNIPIYHTSIITFYPMQYFAQNQNNNFLIFQNPLNEQTTKYIGGQMQKVDLKTNQFFLVHSKIFTDEKTAQDLFQNLQNNYFQNPVFENKNMAVFLENKK